ncbi:hypothetical protein I203_108604 [Kwoniella mangroviensis CBS 8507]|uniref:hypothetical protein n=1 Tax=Kwoniella mangroviensis CBS 8507 TaxID=1296122 RepID=UPI00303C0EB8
MARTAPKRAAVAHSGRKRSHDEMEPKVTDLIPYPTPSTHEDDDLCSLISHEDESQLEKEDDPVSADEGQDVDQDTRDTVDIQPHSSTSSAQNSLISPPESFHPTDGSSMPIQNKPFLISQGVQTDDSSFFTVITPTVNLNRNTQPTRTKKSRVSTSTTTPTRPSTRPRQTRRKQVGVSRTQDVSVASGDMTVERGEELMAEEGASPSAQNDHMSTVEDVPAHNNPLDTPGASKAKGSTEPTPRRTKKPKNTNPVPDPNPMTEPALLLPHGLQPVETTVDNHWVYLFFRFCAERHKMYNRRLAGVPRDQLTEDETMSKVHIGNVYRQLDPSSRNIRENIIGKGDQTPQEICFRLFLYCMFYNESTWNELCSVSTGGLPAWQHYVTDLPAYEGVLYRLSMVEKKKIYYGGFQLVPPTIYFTDNRNRNKDMPHFAASLRLVLAIMLTSLPTKLLECSYAVDASYLLQTIPTFGGFLSLNILCYLNDTSNYTWYYRNFATCGPGPRSYLGRMFGGKSVINSLPMEEAGLIWLYEHQWKYWTRIGEDPPHAEELGLRPGMRVLDIENALCWCHRYINAYEKKGYGNFSQMTKPTYDKEMSDNTHEPHWCIEEKWLKSTSKVIYKDDLDEISRKLGHVVEEGKEVEENVYEVEKIITRRQGSKLKDGWFRVRWKGYTPEEDTWEKQSSIKQGAEESLQDWLDWEKNVWDCIEKVKKEYPYNKPSIAKDEKEIKPEMDDQLNSTNGDDEIEAVGDDQPPMKSTKQVKLEHEA